VTKKCDLLHAGDVFRIRDHAANFSRLHAYGLASNMQLTFETKQIAARRMLRYPKSFEQEPLLKFALQLLANDSLLDRALYYAALPLGQLRIIVLDLQDHWHALKEVRSRKRLAPRYRINQR
jgi:hypothetical protein